MNPDHTTKPGNLDNYLNLPSAAELELLRIFSANAPLAILDVGACEGEESIRYARAFPHATIISFEPLPSNQRLLRENLALHGLTDRVELVPLALSDRTGEANFHVSSGEPAERFAGQSWNYGNKSSSLLAPASDEPMHGWIEFKRRIRVNTDTLAAFCKARGLRRIDFIHLDVQGAESLVIRGADDLLASVCAIWLETSERELYRGQALRPEIDSLLRGHGFLPTISSLAGVEGDFFYVNPRFLRVRIHLWKECLRLVYCRWRISLGALRRRILPLR